MNRNYNRGRKKEYLLKDRFEKEGYIVFRTAGSHSDIDLIAVKPRKVGMADLYPEIHFIQVKSSEKFLEEKMQLKQQNHLQIETYYLPVKTDKFYAHRKHKMERLSKRNAKAKSKLGMAKLKSLSLKNKKRG